MRNVVVMNIPAPAIMVLAVATCALEGKSKI